MSLNFLPQNPSEELDYEVDFANWLKSGETILTHSVSCSNSELLVSRSVIDGKVIRFWAEGGVNGRIYTIEVEIETSIGRRYALSPKFPVQK